MKDPRPVLHAMTPAERAKVPFKGLKALRRLPRLSGGLCENCGCLRFAKCTCQRGAKAVAREQAKKAQAKAEKKEKVS